MLLCLFTLAITGCKEDNKAFNGYVDADLVYLSSDYGGRLVDLATQRGKTVEANQFLFKLEQTNELYSVEMSQLNTKDLMAQRQQAQSQLTYAEINYKRTLGMRRKNAASQNDLDLAKRDIDVAKDQLADIDVKIRNSKVDTEDKKWVVRRKENYAPEHAIVFDTYYTKGEYVQASMPILALITKENIKVVFFVPEAMLNQVPINKKIKITTESGTDLAQGHVYYVSNIAEYTPPIIYSRQESARLVFRIEAKIDQPDLEKIHLGQPVFLELQT